MLDDRQSLHKRRQWVSQFQLENIKAIESKLERRKMVIVGGTVVNCIMKHPIIATMSIIACSFMILNLNQGGNLHGYLTQSKVHHRSHGLRSLGNTAGSSCIKTPFVTPQEAAYEMPTTPPWYAMTKPSHIQLCEELIKRNDVVTYQQQQGNGISDKAAFGKFTVHETPEYCADWSKPHLALLQMISSSIIAYAGERFGLEYQHNCHKVLDANYRHGLEFDVTSVQEIFPENKMPVDQNKVHLGEIVHTLCGQCIQEYSRNSGNYGANESPHHCLVFPDRGAVQKGVVSQNIMRPDGMPEMIQREAQIDEQGKIVSTALESVLPLIKNRIWHVARDWSEEAQIPRNDPTTGVVIFIDAGSSIPIPFHLYRQFIPPFATNIDILSGADCAQGKLSYNNVESVSCLQHGAELRDYLVDSLQHTGVQVSFKLVASTATTYTRMTQTSTLICPPNTISCLLPSLAKDKVKTAILFEAPQSETYYWFDYLADSVSNINVIDLAPQQMRTDQQQQLVEAKYSGFSAEQLIGGEPAGFTRPSPGSGLHSTTSEEDRFRSSNYDVSNPSAGSGSYTYSNPVFDNYSQDETTFSSRGSFDTRSSGSGGTSYTPDMNHLFDKISNFNQRPSETSVVSYDENPSSRTWGSDVAETNAVLYDENYSSSSRTSESDNTEYELLDTDDSEEDIRMSDVEENPYYNSAQDMIGGRSQNDLFRSGGSSSSGRGVNNEELVETEVEIDYQNLFRG